MDTLTTKQRSQRMGLIKSSDTKIELFVRRMVHRMGYRYKLCDPALPGKPDIVFTSRRKVIFVHGCFWHGHNRCRNARLPKSRLDYWVPKIAGNKARDMKVLKLLKSRKWGALTVWECQLQKQDLLQRRVKDFLDATRLLEKAPLDG